MARKTTGSYYTSLHLIDELIKTALKPVVDEKLARAENKEVALLSVKVCDTACGSGAFLIAANNYLARELARLYILTRRNRQTGKSRRQQERCFSTASME